MTQETPGVFAQYIFQVQPKFSYAKRLSEKHLKEFSVFACYREDAMEGARNVMRGRLGDNHYLMVSLSYRWKQP